MLTKAEKQQFAMYVKQQQWRAEGSAKGKRKSDRKESGWFGRKK